MQNPPNSKSIRSFLAFWLTQSLSQLGSAMTSYALVLWVYERTGSALSVSLLTLCTWLPYVAASVFAGGIVDRARKKRLLLLADGVAFLCTACVAVLLAMGRLEVAHVYAANALTGLMNALQSPASAVVSGRLVPRERISRMSGLQSISASAVGVAAPMLAAFLLSALGMGAVLAADLAAFVAAALALLLFVRIPERECAPRAGGLCSGSPLAGLREGFAFLRGDRVVLTLILSISALNFFSRISYENILSPMILARSGSAEVLALVTGILGFGGIAGGLIAVRLPPPRHVSARIFGMAALSFALGDLLMGAGQTPVAWGVAAVGASVPIPILDSGYFHVLYNRVPEALQGRVFAARNALQYASIPAGLLLGGFLADNVFEPLMAAGGAGAQALACAVGTGAGSGMAVMFLLTGASGLLSSAAGFLFLRRALRSADKPPRRT